MPESIKAKRLQAESERLKEQLPPTKQQQIVDVLKQPGKVRQILNILKESPFSLTTAAGYQSTALKQADREPMGGFLWGLLVSVRQE